MAEVTSLSEAVRELVHDGDTVALEGFTHLIPCAAGHEIIRQERRHLTLVRLTPDIVFDQMIGMGVADALIFSWGGNPGVGSLHRFRDAIEHGWPAPLRVEEHTHGALANRYVAGASRLPFAVVRGSAGTDLAAHTSSLAAITCPFTGDRLTAVAALNPDVAIIHAQQADGRGNVMLWGITGVQKEAVLSAARAIVTVEEMVDELAPRADAVVIPSWAITAVAVVPGGSHPSYALDYTDRDNDFYVAWDAISRDRETFVRWMTVNVMRHDGAADGIRRAARAAPAERGEGSATDTTAATGDERATVAAARRLRDGTVCFVGIGRPSVAANLARRTHAPGCVLVYESGTIGAKPRRPPLSIGDAELARTADLIVSLPEIFNYWLAGGRIDVGFLGAAQIDRRGDINTTVIGDYDHPTVRLPGAGGAPEIAAGAREVFVITSHSPRVLVDRLDFRTTAGGRRALDGSGRGVTTVITDLGVLTLDEQGGELCLTAVHEGVAVADVVAATGWPLRVVEPVAVEPPPSAAELAALRELLAPEPVQG